jgi:hypothetical protein
MLLAGGSTAIIQVDRDAAQHNKPAILITGRCGRQIRVRKMLILGESRMVSSGKPNATGAHVWIETEAGLELEE